MTDIVFIDELAVDAVIGIYDWERRIRQPILVSIEMATDIRPAAASEDISLALNYKAVADRVRDYIVSSEFKLLETLAEKTAALIMDEFGVPWLRFCCSKPQAIAGAAGVGVKIERGTLGGASTERL